VRELDIAEVAQRSGLPASTLRYYEEKGLIAAIGRHGLRLALVSLGRAAGFSLEEMARMFAPDGQPRIDRRALVGKADELDRHIRRLAVVSRGLRHAAACKAPSHMECPSFRRILKAAAAGALDSPRGKTRARP